MSSDRQRRSDTVTTGGARTPPSSIAGDGLEESAEEWREEASKARRERREAEAGRKKAEDARDEVEEKMSAAAKKYEARIRQLTEANRALEQRLRTGSAQASSPAPAAGSSRRDTAPNRRTPIDSSPAKVVTPARVPSRAPEFPVAGGVDPQPASDNRMLPPPPARAAPTTQAPGSTSTNRRVSQPPAQGAIASGSGPQVQRASTSGHGQGAANPEPYEDFATENISPAPTSQRRAPRQVEKAVPPPKQAQPPKPKRKVPSQPAGTTYRVSKPRHASPEVRDRLAAKNFFFLLEDHEDILDLVDDWDSQEPIDHTYPHPGAGDCQIAIGDVIQYYPQYKSWDPCHHIPRTNSHIPHHSLCWYGIVVDYTESGARDEPIKNEEGEEIGRVEVETEGVESVSIMWLYSQDELRDIYNGKFGDDMLPYKNDAHLKKLSETDALDSRDRVLSTCIEGMTMYGLIRTVPVKDVGINDGANGKIVIRFDMPWLVFNKATKKRGRNGKAMRAHVSEKRIKVDLSPIQDEEAEPDSDADES